MHAYVLNYCIRVGIFDVYTTDNVNQTIYAGENDLVCGDDTLGASLSDNEISANDYNAVLSVEINHIL